ncbi:MAG: diguanylate cyclase, partial [Candidatus Riflebacteria bacterium]|nr:diguanylate cyclase [Candidatus Riflebacteria bacterium]
NIADKTNEEFISSIIGECGKTIASLLRDSDKASSNQERFYCLLPNTDAAGAVYFSGRVKEVIEASHFKYNKKDYKLTLSVGISTYPDNIKDSKAILNSAVQAVVNAHKAGGNRAVIYK